MSVRDAGRTKLAHRKCHVTEHGAGIILTGLDALLVGNAIFGRLNQILGGTNDANDRENAERNRQIALSFSVCECTVKTLANRLGNVAAAATAMAFALLFTDARAKHDGIDDLYYRDVIGK